MQPIYEVVSGQILLSRRREFFRLHSEILLPIMRDIGINPKMLLITEIGRYGKFLDIYQYQDLAEDFLVSDRGRRGITEPIKISPRAVTKKPFVLSRSAGGDRYGH